jgi:hypothetical protein
MKTIFDKVTRDELIKKINMLDENSKAQWGKMNIYQMLKYCVLCEEMYLGKTSYKSAFIGYLFGKMALKNLVKDEKPLKRNEPASPGFKVLKNNGDVFAERKKWISLIEAYAHFSNDDFVHGFFGKMTKEQIGYFAYKHTDHHLRQFGV